MSLGEEEERMGSAVRQILVIDGDPAVAEVLAEMLAGAGYAVCRCGRDDEALALARATLPDLILLDLHLPGADRADGLAGLRLADRLARDPQARTIPLLLLAGVAPQERGPWSDLLAGRARPVLFKPFGMATLLEAVAHHLTGHT
jgi:CheY-like chemotaxis protein